MNRYKLFYDGSCGMCRATVRVIGWLHPKQRIVLVDASDASQVAKHSTRLSPARAMQSVHLLLPDGQLLHGYDAVVEIVRLLPGLGWLASLMRTRIARRIGWAVYEWVTAHRHQISHALALE